MGPSGRSTSSRSRCTTRSRRRSAARREPPSSKDLTVMGWVRGTPYASSCYPAGTTTRCASRRAGCLESRTCQPSRDSSLRRKRWKPYRRRTTSWASRQGAGRAACSSRMTTEHSPPPWQVWTCPCPSEGQRASKCRCAESRERKKLKVTNKKTELSSIPFAASSRLRSFTCPAPPPLQICHVVQHHKPGIGNVSASDSTSAFSASSSGQPAEILAST
mmetsp:Transcript_12012/g.26936  ORF Transcript_12012/g.26936 Transcript_12012/m.26936 type:complete len:218 (+) Transcript_12012:197-850(+)